MVCMAWRDQRTQRNHQSKCHWIHWWFHLGRARDKGTRIWNQNWQSSACSLCMSWNGAPSGCTKELRTRKSKNVCCLKQDFTVWHSLGSQCNLKWNQFLKNSSSSQMLEFYLCCIHCAPEFFSFLHALHNQICTRCRCFTFLHTGATFLRGVFKEALIHSLRHV